MQPNTEYQTLQQAYDWFNEKLFDNALPNCLITLHGKSDRHLGHYAPNRFSARFANVHVDELALNPATFTQRTDEQILSTLVHEMAHVWQQHFGSPSRNGYHNKEWGLKMDEIGLTPSNTSEPGGKRTGQQMSHYVVEDGPFHVALQTLLTTDYRLIWQSQPEVTKKKIKKSKVKYTCVACGNNAWAKPNINLMCGDCEEMMLKEEDYPDED